MEIIRSSHHINKFLNQYLSSDFYDLKHFAHADCFKWKLNFKHRYLPMYAWY